MQEFAEDVVNLVLLKPHFHLFPARIKYFIGGEVPTVAVDIAVDHVLLSVLIQPILQFRGLVLKKRNVFELI